MTLDESTYFDFTFLLAEKEIDFNEYRMFDREYETVLVIPKKKYKERLFYVESGKQIL